MREINTIFFDFDGVIIDSEPLHAKAKKLTLEKLMIPYPSTIFDDYKGRTDKVFFDYVSSNLDPQKRPSESVLSFKRNIFEEIISELKLIDGFLSFLERVKAKGINTALVSSTSLHSLRLVDELFQISQLFEVVITEVDTKLHKPYPDPYLKALKVTAANILNTIVIEDSPNGIISSKKAGCFTYGLTTSFKSHILTEAGADEIIDSYEDLIKKLNI